MDYATFVQLNSEFSELDQTTVVQPALDDATRRTDPQVFGAETDQAIRWLAAHLLISGPNGRLVRDALGKNGQSTYLDERRRLEEECGHMWIGSFDCV